MKIISTLKDEITKYCNTLSEALDDTYIHVITQEEQEENKLDVEEILLNSDKHNAKPNQRIADKINQVISGQATIDDLIATAIKVKKESVND